ncbi:MAG: T9SS C-terminal target domain-containing protein, partial [Bacteroidia bacterium]
MKKLYFLFFLTIGFFANAQIVNIPDANFKATLLSANSSNIIARNLAGYYFTIDSNNDGEIQIIEAQQVKQLNIANKNISNLTGIEAFINLDDLGCSNN